MSESVRRCWCSMCARKTDWNELESGEYKCSVCLTVKKLRIVKTRLEGDITIIPKPLHEIMIGLTMIMKDVDAKEAEQLVGTFLGNNYPGVKVEK